MKITYFSSSDTTRKPFSDERNEGIEAVPVLLRQLKARGYDVEFVDISNLSEKDRFEFYVRVIPPAVYKHYEIKKMLGTNRHSACWFGAEVPALLVTEADSVGDTYPHRIGNRITTIHGFLAALLVARAAQSN
jgi:hypothetical protein